MGLTLRPSPLSPDNQSTLSDPGEVRRRVCVWSCLGAAPLPRPAPRVASPHSLTLSLPSQRAGTGARGRSAVVVSCKSGWTVTSREGVAPLANVRALASLENVRAFASLVDW